MSGPFAFMGCTRGADRPDTAPDQTRDSERRFVVVKDPELATASGDVLAERHRQLINSGNIDVDVPGVASRYGFDADALWVGMWALRYEGSVPVAFLVAPGAHRLARPGPGFERFVLTQGVEFA